MDNDEERPPSRPDTGTGTSTETCEYCGATIETSDWYPVTKERDSEGALRFYSFCTEDCQNAWLDERSG